jgi:hypothetical protein
MVEFIGTLGLIGRTVRGRVHRAFVRHPSVIRFCLTLAVEYITMLAIVGPCQQDGYVDHSKS